MGESCILNAIACVLPIVGIFCRTTIRGKIREAKGIAGTGCDDCVKVTFCCVSSLVQEARVSAGSKASYMHVGGTTGKPGQLVYHSCWYCSLISSTCLAQLSL